MPLPASNDCSSSEIYTKVDVENLSETFENEKIVIIHPGSCYLRMSLSTSCHIVKIPHCIARKIRHNIHDDGQLLSTVDDKKCSSSYNIRYEDNYFNRTNLEHPNSRYQRSEGLNSAASCLMMRWKELKLNRKIMKLDKVLPFNSNSVFTLDEPPPVPYKSEMDKNVLDNNKVFPEFLVGEEALLTLPSMYNFHQPWKCAELNVHSFVGGSIFSVVQDLYDIWMHTLSSYLAINQSNIKMFKAVLIIPDSYKRSNVKELVDMMMNKMGFSQMFVVQESVCCSFGDGSRTCCVVDVGHCKTSVCCIEDGLIKKNTLFTARLGGSDVTKCYLWLLNKYGLTNKNVNLVENSRRCSLFIQHLKERYCHLMDDKSLVENVETSFSIDSFLSSSTTAPLLSAMFKFHMSDERMLTPLCLFFPDMLGLKATPGIHKSMIFGVEKSVSDASDYLDDEYIRQTTTKREQAARLRKKEVYENHTNTLLQDAICPDETMASNDYEALDQPDSALKGNKNDDDSDWLNVYESTLVGLHQLAFKSIDRCESEDTKQKMFSNILLTGGGSKFMGIHLYFEYLLSCHMQSIKNRNVYDINIKIKDDDLGIRGACIMSCLDTVQELWFDKYQWCKYSVRILREKCPFVW